MKILIIQENGRHDKNRLFRECFSLQRSIKKENIDCDVWGLNHNNWSGVIPDFNKYDVIINLENYDDINWLPDLSKYTKPYKMMWCIDAHCRGMEPYLKVFKDGKYNLILQSTIDYISDPNVSVWFPNCYDNTLVQPRNIEKRCDIGFCGNILNRGELLNILETKFKVIKDVFVIGDDMVNAINSYKIHFNRNISNDINYRNFETIGCNVPLLTNYNPTYEHLGFKDGINCMIYKTVPEMIEKSQLLLNDPKLLQTISQNGYELSKKHTYDVRAKSLLNFLKTKI